MKFFGALKLLAHLDGETFWHKKTRRSVHNGDEDYIEEQFPDNSLFSPRPGLLLRTTTHPK